MTLTLGTLALVPVRLGGLTRLAGHLDRGARDELAVAMAQDVVAALEASEGIDRMLITCPDGHGLETAGSRWSAEIVRDPAGRGSLDDVVSAIATGGLDALLVVMADLPCLTPSDVEALLTTEAAVALAPARDGGTAALLRRPPTVMSTAYGPASATRHQQLALEAGLTLAVVDVPGFAHDVDTWGDLMSLPPDLVGPATTRFLDRIAQR